MSVRVQDYVLAAYALPLVAKPVDFCSTKSHPSKVVPISINWAQYTSFAVTINLNQGTAGTTMDKVVGCYVDNSQNQQSLTLICPDTGYRIDCPAGQQNFFPLFTVSNTINIYNGALFSSLNTIDSDILILFTNFVYDPLSTESFVTSLGKQQITSTFINNQKQSAFVNNVIGDRHFESGPFDLGTVTAGVPMFSFAVPTGMNNGLFIITNMTVAIFNCYSAGSPINLQMGFDLLFNNQLHTFRAIINSTTDYIPFTVLQQLPNIYNRSLVINNVLSPAPIFFNVNSIPGGKAYFSFDCLFT